MARLGIAVWLALAVASLAVAAHAAPGTPAPPQTAAVPDRAQGAASVSVETDLQRNLLRELNVLRRRAGLPALRHSDDLDAAALSHSKSMARYGYFSHTSYNGSLFWQRIARFYRAPHYYRVYRLGENLMSGPASASASTVMRAWLNSPPHRENLYAKWTDVGFGCVLAVDAPGVFDGETVAIVTADFGARG